MSNQERTACPMCHPEVFDAGVELTPVPLWCERHTAEMSRLGGSFALPKEARPEMPLFAGAAALGPNPNWQGLFLEQQRLTVYLEHRLRLQQSVHEGFGELTRLHQGIVDDLRARVNVLEAECEAARAKLKTGTWAISGQSGSSALPKEAQEFERLQERHEALTEETPAPGAFGVYPNGRY